MYKYVKVMFGNKGANFEYKIGKVNVATSWNPKAEKGRDFGGFNYCKEECILRWLHRGDTIYDVEVPNDAENNFNMDDYLVVDTDDIFSDKRFEQSKGINKELGTYFRNKYKELPALSNDFDLIYKEILNYCKNIDKTIVIDCAQFHCCKDINILKGKLIMIRTSIDECYKRVLDRWINNYKKNNWKYTKEEFNNYKTRKASIYKWYKETNKFLEKIDKI